MTTLNGPALEKAKRAVLAEITSGVTDAPTNLETGIAAYMAALPQSGVAARLLARADDFKHTHGGGDGLGFYGPLSEQLDREAAALLSGVELPGWRDIDDQAKNGADWQLWLPKSEMQIVGFYDGEKPFPWRTADGIGYRDTAVTMYRPLFPAPPPPVTGDAP